MPGLENAGKVLVLVGIFLMSFGLLFIFWHRIPLLGRLPGDIVVRKGGFQLFFPLVTSLLLSLVLTIVLNVVLRIFK